MHNSTGDDTGVDFIYAFSIFFPSLLVVAGLFLTFKTCITASSSPPKYEPEEEIPPRYEDIA